MPTVVLHLTPVEDSGEGAKLDKTSDVNSKPITGSNGDAGWQTSTVVGKSTTGIETIEIVLDSISGSHIPWPPTVRVKVNWPASISSWLGRYEGWVVSLLNHSPDPEESHW